MKKEREGGRREAEGWSNKLKTNKTNSSNYSQVTTRQSVQFSKHIDDSLHGESLHGTAALMPLAESAPCLTNCLVSEHSTAIEEQKVTNTGPLDSGTGKTILFITEQFSIISGDGGETYMSSSKEGTCQLLFTFLQFIFRFLKKLKWVDFTVSC